MRIVIQRVSRAAVRVGGRTVGEVGRGYCVLAGWTHADTAAEVDWMADKIAGLRLFPDAEGRMNLSLGDVGGGVLLVSQFTLYGDIERGRRPSFVGAARPEAAIPLYERFAAALRARGIETATGEFGAMMEVELVNDGPVTLIVERNAG
jgi:D-aminoacyl-tRNA deacylase